VQLLLLLLQLQHPTLLFYAGAAANCTGSAQHDACCMYWACLPGSNHPSHNI
jgi:hypothetical protein